jgi:hypothetical protein
VGLRTVVRAQTSANNNGRCIIRRPCKLERALHEFGTSAARGNTRPNDAQRAVGPSAASQGVGRRPRQGARAAGSGWALWPTPPCVYPGSSGRVGVLQAVAAVDQSLYPRCTLCRVLQSRRYGTLTPPRRLSARCLPCASSYPDASLARLRSAPGRPCCAGLRSALPMLLIA